MPSPVQPACPPSPGTLQGLLRALDRRDAQSSATPIQDLSERLWSVCQQQGLSVSPAEAERLVIETSSQAVPAWTETDPSGDLVDLDVDMKEYLNARPKNRHD